MHESKQGVFLMSLGQNKEADQMVDRAFMSLQAAGPLKADIR